MSEQQATTSSTTTATTHQVVNGVTVGCQDSFIRMYHHFSRKFDDNNGEDIQPSGLLVGHLKPVSALDSVCFGSSENAKHRIVSGGWDGDVRVFDANSMECLVLLENTSKPPEEIESPHDTLTVKGKGHSMEVLAVSHAKLGAEEALLVTGGMDSTVRVWKWRTTEDARVDEINYETTLNHREGKEDIGVWSLTVDTGASNPVVYSSCLHDGMIRGYDITTQKLVAKMKLHTSDVRHVKVTDLQSKATLISCSSDKSIKCVDLRGNKVSMRAENVSTNTVMHFSLDDNNNMLYCADNAGCIRSLDTRMGLKKVDEVKNAHRGGITKIVYNKGLIYTGGGADKVVRVWDANKRLAPVAFVPVNDAIFSMAKLH
ncbi:predicted protein [Naegleria gruberi]|uniref:Predicted protein n=1 Tax=Naegleria gruberi TaxID=5762 RepID=D2VVE6_NAEGR|nr:uncharacterized protein NAEGRDRAFT_72989 [Naegleria gruberi]EFC39220.1 predicted protein [Naegleria gruberi]|eukprot:XP_002671964.1 predicted protein [Naegleria gruberi strain NEG-M]